MTLSNRPRLQSKQGFHLDDAERIARRFSDQCTKETLQETIKDITHNLSVYGISFEGRKLPISLMPTVVPESEIDSVSAAGLAIKRILERIVEKFIDEHQKKIFDGPMHRFFTPYYKWWDLIASEVRLSRHIQLMRYDAVRDDHGRWSFMETNTACPGGTIHCARIRDAWMMTKFGRQICKNEPIKELPIDNPSSFVRLLSEKAVEIDKKNPNIAILNYRGTYTNELDSLRNEHAEMRKRGQIESGVLVLGDIRDIECKEGRAYLNDLPIALIYNKIDQLQIDPQSPDVQGWVQAAQAPHTEFLNSPGKTPSPNEIRDRLGDLKTSKWIAQNSCEIQPIKIRPICEDSEFEANSVLGLYQIDGRWSGALVRAQKNADVINVAGGSTIGWGYEVKTL